MLGFLEAGLYLLVFFKMVIFVVSLWAFSMGAFRALPCPIFVDLRAALFFFFLIKSG